VADRGDKLARRLFFVSIVILAVAYGIGANEYGLFPVPLVKDAKVAAKTLMEDAGMTLPWWFHRSTDTTRVRVHEASAITPGLRLIGGLARDQTTVVNVMDVQGRVVHSWRLDWFAIWPDPTHLPDEEVPKSNRPLVQGMALASNGDLLFTFEALGMVRLDPCGKVVWKLPYRTHHSIHVDDSGNIWAPGLITRHEPRPNLPNHAPPFYEFTIVKVSPAGRILQEISTLDLLVKNDLSGLLYMSNISDRSTRVTGDTLHLNDVETFPSSLAPGVFGPGDVLISLRNINTILAFDSTSQRIKFMSVGAVIRQHDPDFVDGNTISVFDNHLVSAEGQAYVRRPHRNSRIVTLSASTGHVEVTFRGTPDQSFYTATMGTHQLLPNGNMLLTESLAGRAIEVTSGGRVAWEYLNLVDDGLVGIVSDAMVLPSHFDEAFFAEASATCSRATQN
jgi:hypothetical protein